MALLVERYHVEGSTAPIGRNVAVALFAIAGFWGMIVFYIWRSTVQDDIEEELQNEYVNHVHCVCGWRCTNDHVEMRHLLS